MSRRDCLVLHILLIAVFTAPRAQGVRIGPAGMQNMEWVPGKVEGFSGTGGTKAVRQPDESVLVTGPNPDVATYTVHLRAAPGEISALRIEALTHRSLASVPGDSFIRGAGGPGRSQHGNFVISEVSALVTAVSISHGQVTTLNQKSVRFARAEADYEPEGYTAASTIDRNTKTGWAIHGTGSWNANRTLTLTLERPVKSNVATRWTIRIDQQHGTSHTLGRFRISVGRVKAASPPPPPPPPSTAKMTGFNPAVHGFRFDNVFKNEIFAPPVNVQSAGLCGGMSYTALDYYLAGIEPPRQEYRPARGTWLQKYLYARQETSLALNLDKWAELNSDPAFLARQNFFNTALGRLNELKSFIDKGQPIPLGLEGGSHSDHQVLAIGYDLGSYQGNLGPNQGDVKIFLCEPNHPREKITMVADPAKLDFYYKEHPETRWRGCYVDSRYTRNEPPRPTVATYPNDGLVHELLLEFGTGFDDMNGGNVILEIIAEGTPPQKYENINQGGRWLPDFTETAQVVLTNPVRPEKIRLLKIAMKPSAGPFVDVWDVYKVWTRVVVGNGAPGGVAQPLHEFNKPLNDPFKLRASAGSELVIGIPPK